MKILLIGSKKSIESQKLKKEAEKRGHQLEVIPLTKLIFKIDKNFSILTQKNKNIAEFEVVLFRAINKHITEAKIIAEYMKKEGRVIIDEILAQGDYDYHKFLMHAKLAEKKIPQPATYFPLSFNGLKKAIEKIKPPLVVKHIKEMHGRNVFRFDNQKDVLDFFSQNKPPHQKFWCGGKKQRLGLPRGKAGRYLIQEWYPAKKYYRVLVLGGRALGAMERLSLLSKKRPGIPLAERSKQTILTPALKKIALEAAKALGIDFAGLDIMPDKNGHLSVLEANRSPQFKRFSRVTGINVAEEVIKYIERKSSE